MPDRSEVLDAAQKMEAAVAALNETLAHAVEHGERRDADLADQNVYLHQRVHDLAAMITIIYGAIALLWDRAGLEAELGPLELHGLPPLDEPPTVAP